MLDLEPGRRIYVVCKCGVNRQVCLCVLYVKLVVECRDTRATGDRKSAATEGEETPQDVYPMG